MRWFIGGIAVVVALAALVLWRTSRDPEGYRDGETPPPPPVEEPDEPAVDPLRAALVRWLDDPEAPAPEITPALLPHVEDLLGERRERDRLIALLGELGAADRLCALVATGRAHDAAAAATALGAVEPKPPVVAETLAKALAHRNGKVRDAAAASLPACGAPAAAPVLAQAQTRHKRTLAHVVDVLVRLGPDALPVLRGALESENDRTRGTAAVALARSGQELGAALERLFALAYGEDKLLRSHARAYFENPVNVNASAAAATLDGLRHPAEEVRRLAARVAARLGPAIRAGEEALLELLLDAQTQTRYDALEALTGMQSRAAVPFVIAATTSNDSEFRIRAVRSLARLGHDTEKVRAALQAVVRDDQPEVAIEAALAWRQLTGESAYVRDLAPKLLADAYDRDFRAAGYRAVAALGAAGVDLWEPVVKAAVEHGEFAAAREALAALGPGGTEGLVALLVPAAKEENAAIAGLLAQPARGAERFAARLDARLESEDQAVRRAAAFVRASQGHAPAFDVLVAAGARAELERLAALPRPVVADAARAALAKLE